VAAKTSRATANGAHVPHHHEIGAGATPTKQPTQRSVARTHPDVDRVIEIPASWWQKPHRRQLRYFIPEWDDLVDPDFDFDTDTHSSGAADWSNEVYAHQLYTEPNYDGLLLSRVVAEKTRAKKERINRLGVHRYFRVPRAFPVMGDCGAFGYVMEKAPPFSTRDILDYYTRLDFDLGVSIDHLIITATQSEKQERYKLTIDNAAEFIQEHRKQELTWEPIGAVQGWDPASYTEAARQVVAMGYRYIGLGGLVRTSTRDILHILEQVHDVVPKTVSIHLFGLARIRALSDFARLGVRSVDSASFLRRAWMGTGQNYLTLSGDLYAAIRVPEAGRSFRAKRMVSDGRASAERVEELEQKCLQTLIRFDQGHLTPRETLTVILEYDQLITPGRPENSSLLLRTLEERPWKSCPCDICQRYGIQVIMFRGNNRNRRRGFHNTYVFYRLVEQVLAGAPMPKFNQGDKDGSHQLSLFEMAGAVG
jgi:hypothetical protein